MKEKKFLIVVDMQNDFIDGSLGTPEAQKMLPEAVKVIEQARREGDTVIATLDTHGENYLETAEGRKLPVEHCIRGTKGWEIHPAVQAALGNAILVEKPTFGSMKLPHIIEENLSEEDVPVITLMGLCTDICVVSNTLLLKAAFPEAAIRVAERACAGVTREKHEAALETMRSCQVDMI